MGRGQARDVLGSQHAESSRPAHLPALRALPTPPQESAAQARDLRLRQLRQELEEQTIMHARRCIAAQRIARAWAAFQGGPAAMRRHAAATELQGAIRARRARQLAARLRAQREALAAVDRAVQAGCLEMLQAAVEAAQREGAGLGLTVRLLLALWGSAGVACGP